MTSVEERSRPRNNKPVIDSAPVVYWMQRDQRVEDNWSLIYAQQKAIERNVAFCVIFALATSNKNAYARHYDFMLKGLKEIEEILQTLNIPFYILNGDPRKTVSDFVQAHGVGEVVFDFNPLRIPEAWRAAVSESVSVRCTEVDGRNIVPCWLASDKEEFAAYTFRPKIHRQLLKFLHEFPLLETQQNINNFLIEKIDWKVVREKIPLNDSVSVVNWITPGARAAKETLQMFIDEKIDGYAEGRNDPNKSVQSNLSPYLHFGQISSQRIALLVQKATDKNKSSRDAFIEELIVRRELADNYCYYNKQYNKIAGAHPWAQQTVTEHRNDSREYVYTVEEFERAKTHDELWNAMQLQMMKEGKMHGWCRMYWAKKILEWTPDTQTAIDIALYLNDKYQLDGRDTNGVVGVMWSICGVHDRAWTERSVFGKIRYMNFSGAKRKFDVKKYITRYSHTTESLFNE